MKLPSKVTSYKESIIFYFPLILNNLIKRDMSVYELYSILQKDILSINDFMLALDYLYAMNKISYYEEKEVVHYVK